MANAQPRQSKRPDLLRWTIDVCATCGAQATYPFSCGHRRTDQTWTIPVIVQAAYPVDLRKALA